MFNNLKFLKNNNIKNKIVSIYIYTLLLNIINIFIIII